jgi:hypothetical protein
LLHLSKLNPETAERILTQQFDLEAFNALFDTLDDRYTPFLRMKIDASIHDQSTWRIEGLIHSEASFALATYGSALIQMRRQMSERKLIDDSMTLDDLLGSPTIDEIASLSKYWLEDELRAKWLLCNKFEESARQPVDRSRWPALFKGCIRLGPYAYICLTTARSLEKEGVAMETCVGSYSSLCGSGHSHVVSVRKYGRRCATLHITASNNKSKPWTLHQSSGPRNHVLDGVSIRNIAVFFNQIESLVRETATVPPSDIGYPAALPTDFDSPQAKLALEEPAFGALFDEDVMDAIGCYERIFRTIDDEIPWSKVTSRIWYELVCWEMRQSWGDDYEPYDARLERPLLERTGCIIHHSFSSADVLQNQYRIVDKPFPYASQIWKHKAQLPQSSSISDNKSGQDFN